MYWFLNDASLQGQFGESGEFEAVLRALLGLRAAKPDVRRRLRATRSFASSTVSKHLLVRELLAGHRDKDLKRAVLDWLDRSGPFIDDERFPEADDYFEYDGLDITSTGLGEAARRTKADAPSTTFSFVGGPKNFAIHPLEVDHGLPEDRLGKYRVPNIWDPQDLATQVAALEPAAANWAELLQTARQRFPNLEIGPLERNPVLAREPFEASIRDRVLELLQILNEYVGFRDAHGKESKQAREIIDLHFTGENARFTGESSTNQKDFKAAMVFDRSFGEGEFFAHWHGKISHRFFRVHFEWPLAGARKKLEIFYLGPKLTKN
ncbi:hypothetical protein ELG72_24935 [Rhizobium leguminosarum]|uniref:hypothetical protein n=1 Tax=Rhizobium leguminosarum TaxID=384 RepID=UPI001031A9CB|nr:hypothetical protein [Rhizobium leguminosarum]TBG66106.1 hypothetical protein ELG72_24935 [Rhizobium leguminosarum]